MGTDFRDPAAMARLFANPARWNSTDDQTFRVMLFTSLLNYGVSGAPDDVEALIRQLYLHSVVRLSVSERLRLLESVWDQIEEFPGAAALYGLVALNDTDHRIISTAALNLAVAMRPAIDDPMRGPSTIRALAERSDDQVTKVGLLSGLLLLGDRRTLPILDGCWRLLDEKGRRQLAASKSGYAYASVIDFFLSWLDDSTLTGDDASFGCVAAAIASMTIYADSVVDVERKLPVWADDDRPPVLLLQEWSIAEYGQIIAPRLQDLAVRESEPKVLHRVFPLWGIIEDSEQGVGLEFGRDQPATQPLGNHVTVPSIEQLIAETREAAQAQRCTQCGGPLEPGFGSLCASCHDTALAQIATLMGVREIWSEEWEEGYPTAAHPIWGVLTRTLDRKNAGDSVEDIYRILDELNVYDTLRIIDTPHGQVAIERVDVPHTAPDQCWIIRWGQNDASTFLAAFHGPERDRQVAELVASFAG